MKYAVDHGGVWKILISSSLSWNMGLDISEIEVNKTDDTNVIVGYSHFIKTVEDLTEIVRTTAPEAKFSVTFSEASGPRLVRFEGNDSELVEYGIENIKRIASGHTFMIILRNAFPISILNALKLCQEVGTIYAATANPLKVLVARGEDGNGVIGVIDGGSPLGVESEDDKKKRRQFLRDIGYKG